MDLTHTWHTLLWPLGRLLVSLAFGLLVANLIEALNWTRFLARLAAPVIRLGHLQDVVGASFSMAFFSGMAANSLLAEAYGAGRLSDRELVLANLFNSLPTYFLHLPQMFFVTVPFLGPRPAGLYVGLTLFAALLRSVAILVYGRAVLPPLPDGCVVCHLKDNDFSWGKALRKGWHRFTRRIRSMVLFTVPIYIGIHYITVFGFFDAVEKWLSAHLGFLSFLTPQAISIVMFQVVAESTAGLAAAGAMLGAGDLTTRQVVLALLVGNILSTPMRAFRHQFPYYAGIFKPRTAARLILHNQAFRAASILLVTVGYAVLG
ncbi:hypothetical protein DFW101_2793 [Solidesulfovibrio carbinoliphilus subsp. oakridgensis]|uniref:Nucleoside recognition domain protein n=1 Tax=Solidesulfovibrio carbinoliphilus subsp. oakridgensis TaxID=694327 RepID=G7QB55_9BACT|nr:membrane protein [Solidesulfovibrio carbinoliphilus]EHJ48797.1 hypothetical protein DFW101_2793 [Solidesulfovibrio carbinoliphilus subsp. oakridgensis]